MWEIPGPFGGGTGPKMPPLTWSRTARMSPVSCEICHQPEVPPVREHLLGYDERITGGERNLQARLRFRIARRYGAAAPAVPETRSRFPHPQDCSW